MTETASAAFDTVASGLYLEGLAVDHARDVIWYSDVIAGGIHGVKPDGTKVATFNPDRMWTGGVLMNAGLPDYAPPAGSITQLRFGGADGRDVYFNSVPSDGGDTLKEGGEITETNSFLYRGRSETPGLKIEPARFTLE